MHPELQEAIDLHDAIVAEGSKALVGYDTEKALANIPVGTVIHAVELRPAGGAKMGRSAGTGIQLLAKEAGKATLRAPS